MNQSSLVVDSYWIAIFEATMLTKYGLIRAVAMAYAAATMTTFGDAANATSAPIYPYVVPTSPDPLMSNLAIPPDAASKGMWSTTQKWPLVGIHLSVLPDGRVLSFGTPVGQSVKDGRTFDVWNPAFGFTADSHMTFPNAQSVDSFCGTTAILPRTGQVLVSGGGSGGDRYQSFLSTLMTPSSTSSIDLGYPLASQRWYATMITLADGRQLIGGGGAISAAAFAPYLNPSAAQPNISVTPEIFSPGQGWSSLFGAASNDAFGPVNNHFWYPRMWVAPDGTVYGISMEKVWSLDPIKNTITTLGTFKTTVDANALPNVGPTSTAVMFDVGKVLQVGGNGYANNYLSPSSPHATVFDLSQPQILSAKDTADMTYPRQWANSLVLPDGKVLVTGGSTYADTAGPNAVYPAEIWYPSKGSWTVGASAANYRGYHSATALLPNGAVLSTGGGVGGPVANFNAEIFYPPYLFERAGGKSKLAVRPQIVSMGTSTAGYGAKLLVQLTNRKPIVEASLVGLSSVTHSFNTFQRRIKLPFTQAGAHLMLTMPQTANVAPPGYYLLTVLDSFRTPSIGVVVAIGGAAAPPAPSKVAASPQFVNIAGLTQIGSSATRISRGVDGTTVVVSSQDGGSLWRFSGGKASADLHAPVPMTDVAVVNSVSIYAIGVDQNVYRYDGTAWTVVGHKAASVGAASDGTVVIVSTDKNTIWRKNGDSNVDAWSQIPGYAQRVSPLSANSIWAIGTDNIIYRGDATGNFIPAGANARDISTSPDGHVLVVNSPSNQLFIKFGDNTTQTYSNVAFTALSVAVTDGGGVIAVGTDGNVYRSANIAIY